MVRTAANPSRAVWNPIASPHVRSTAASSPEAVGAVCGQFGSLYSSTSSSSGTSISVTADVRDVPFSSSVKIFSSMSPAAWAAALATGRLRRPSEASSPRAPLRNASKDSRRPATDSAAQAVSSDLAVPSSRWALRHSHTAARTRSTNCRTLLRPDPWMTRPPVPRSSPSIRSISSSMCDGRSSRFSRASARSSASAAPLTTAVRTLPSNPWGASHCFTIWEARWNRILGGTSWLRHASTAS